MRHTFANGTGGSLFLSLVAAVSYSGANLLQCPHHGAKNSTSTVSCWPILVLKSAALKSITSELMTNFIIAIIVSIGNHFFISDIFLLNITFTLLSIKCIFYHNLVFYYTRVCYLLINSFIILTVLLNLLLNK